MKTIKILMNLSFKKFAMFGLVGSMSLVMTACNNGSSNKSNVPGVIPASGIPNNPRMNPTNLGNGQIQTANGNLSQDPALTNLLLKKESEEAERVKSIREAQERNEAEARKSKIALENLKKENLLLMQAMNRNANNNPCATVDPCGNRRVVTPPTVIANPCPPTTDPCAGQGGNRNGNNNGSNNGNNGRNNSGVIANPCPPTTDPCAGQNGSNGTVVIVNPPNYGNGNSNGSPCSAVVTDPCTGQRVTVPVVGTGDTVGGNQQVVLTPENPCHTVNPCGSTTIQVVVSQDQETIRRTIELNERTQRNFEELEKAKARLDEQQGEIDRLQKELARIEANKTTVVCCERGRERSQETVTTRTETVTTRTETVVRGEEEVVEVERDGVIVRIAKGIGDAISGIGRFLFGSSEKRRVPAPVEERSIVTVTEAKESCDEAKVQLETMKVAVAEAETKLTTALTERDQARAEVAEVKQNSVPKEKVQVIVAKLSETEAALAKKNAEVEELNRRLADAQAEIDKLKAAGASKVAKQPAKPAEKNGPNKPVVAAKPATVAPAKPVVAAKPAVVAPAKPVAKPGTNCVTKEVQVCTPDNNSAVNKPVVADAKADAKVKEEAVSEQASNGKTKTAQLLLGKLSVSDDTSSEIKAETTFKATGRACMIVLDNTTSNISAMKLAHLQFAYKTESGEPKAENVITNLTTLAELSNPPEASLKKTFAEGAEKRTVNGQSVYVVYQCASNAQAVANNPKITKTVLVQCREVAFKTLDGLQSDKPEEIYAAAMKVISAQARILSVSSTSIEMNFNQDKLIDAKVRNDLRDHSKGDAFKLSLVQSNEMRCQ